MFNWSLVIDYRILCHKLPITDNISLPINNTALLLL